MSIRRSRIQVKPNIRSKLPNRAAVVVGSTTSKNDKPLTGSLGVDSVDESQEKFISSTPTTDVFVSPITASVDASKDCVKTAVSSDQKESEPQYNETECSSNLPSISKARISRRFVKPNLTDASRSKRSTVSATVQPSLQKDIPLDPVSLALLSEEPVVIDDAQAINECELEVCSEVVVETPSVLSSDVADSNDVQSDQEQAATPTVVTETTKPRRVTKRLPPITAPRDKPPDKFTMKMIDLIRWNPISNPMKERTGPKAPPRPPVELDDPVADEGDDGDPTPVPQIKIGPDGNVIINEASLVIETTQTTVDESTLGEAVTEDADSGVSYSSFRKGNSRPKYWSSEETQKFFWALSHVGTDFSLMTKIFPKRPRSDLKLKFKKEERKNRFAVENALVGNKKDLILSVFEKPFVPKSKKAPVRKTRQAKENRSLSYYEDSDTLTATEAADMTSVATNTASIEIQPQVQEVSVIIDAVQNSDHDMDGANYHRDGSDGSDEEDGHKTIAKPDIVHESDDEEERILENLVKTTTRYGRQMKRTKRSIEAENIAVKKPRGVEDGAAISDGEGSIARVNVKVVETSSTARDDVMRDSPAIETPLNAMVVETVSTARETTTGDGEAVGAAIKSPPANVKVVGTGPLARETTAGDNQAVAAAIKSPPANAKPLDVNKLRSIASSPGNQLLLVKQPAGDGSSRAVVHVYMVSPPHRPTALASPPPLTQTGGSIQQSTNATQDSNAAILSGQMRRNSPTAYRNSPGAVQTNVSSNTVSIPSPRNHPLIRLASPSSSMVSALHQLNSPTYTANFMSPPSSSALHEPQLSTDRCDALGNKSPQSTGISPQATHSSLPKNATLNYVTSRNSEQNKSKTATDTEANTTQVGHLDSVDAPNKLCRQLYSHLDDLTDD